MIGAYLVTEANKKVAHVDTKADTAAQKTELGGYMLGVIFMLIEVLCSGAASAYVEKVLKAQTQEQESIWDRNYQLALWSILSYIVQGGFGAVKNGTSVNPFIGWNLFATML